MNFLQTFRSAASKKSDDRTESILAHIEFPGFRVDNERSGWARFLHTMTRCKAIVYSFKRHRTKHVFAFSAVALHAYKES